MSRLDPRLLLQGYATGIFPMADSRDAEELFWVEPRNRAIIPLDRFHVSHSLRRKLRAGAFTVTRDRDFAAVIRACADREETWIIIRHRGTSEGQVLRCGKSAGLNIQIVEYLQVIRDKSSRTYNHPFDTLRGKLLQDL